MPFFGRKKEKPQFNEPYLVELKFDRGYDPKENIDVEGILKELKHLSQHFDQLVVEKDTYYLTFQQAEEIFDKLRDLAGEKSLTITFESLNILEYDPQEKWAPAKDSEDDGNPHELLNLPGFVIDYKYKNMTKQMFEIIFNLPENADVDYDTKIEICQNLRNAYIESVNINPDHVAQLPSLEEVSKGPVNLSIPAYEARAESKTEAPVSIEQSTTVNNPVYEPTIGKFIEEAPNKAQIVELENPVKQAERKEEIPVSDETKEVKTSNQMTRRTKRQAEDEIKEAVEVAREKGHVEIPQLEVEIMDPVNPSHDNYVAYVMNQKKKNINQSLLVAGRKFNAANERVLIQKRSDYQEKINKALAEFRKVNANYSKEIQDQLNAKLNAEKTKIKEKEIHQIDEERDRQLENVKKNYETACQEFKDEAEDKKKALEDKLEKKYKGIFNIEYQKALKAREKSLAKEEKDNETGLLKKYELEMETDAESLREEANKTLEKLLEEANESLVNVERQAVSDHLNARQTLLAEKRAETEKQRVEAPNEELREVNLDLSQARAQLASVTATKEALEKANADLKQELESKQRESSLLRTENNTLNKEKIANSVAKKDDNANDMIKQFIQLQIAQQLGQQKAIENQKQAKPVASKEEQQLKSMLKGTKRLVTALTCGLLLVLGGGGYYIYQQQTTNQAQVDKLTNQVQVANDKAKALSTSKQQKQSSQSEIDQKATEALHANDQKALSKYSTEKYYQLDTAIITNNADQVKQAVQALGENLKIDDRYRLTQTIALLNQANDQLLANQVQAANR